MYHPCGAANPWRGVPRRWLEGEHKWSGVWSSHVLVLLEKSHSLRGRCPSEEVLLEFIGVPVVVELEGRGGEVLLLIILGAKQSQLKIWSEGRKRVPGGSWKVCNCPVALYLPLPP